MIILNKINAAAKFLLVMAPLFWVAGCTTVGTPAAETAARIQAEPGAERLTRYCRRMAETKNLRIATGICERALAIAPENPEPVLILAQAYAEAQQHQEAAEAFHFALSIDPENPIAHLGLGKLYLREAQLEDAQVHLEAAFQSGHPDPAVFNALGVLKDQLGEHAAAQDFYQSGLELDPNNDALANNLGVSLLLSKSNREIVSDAGDQSEGPSPVASTRESNRQPADTVIAALPETAIAPADNTAGNTAGNTANAVRPAPQVPALNTEVSFLEFFGQSRLLPSDNLDPAVTPAPISIVNFQTLPPLRAQQLQAVTGETPDETILARALQDFSPSQASAQLYAERSLHSETPDMDNAREDRTATLKSRNFVDLAKVMPGRNPFIQVQSHETAPTGTFEAIPDESESNILVADLVYFPIEMPESDSQTKRETPLAAQVTEASFKAEPEPRQVVVEQVVLTAARSGQALERDETLERDEVLERDQVWERPADSSVIDAFHAARTTEALGTGRQVFGSDVTVFSDVIRTEADLPVARDAQYPENHGKSGDFRREFPAPDQPDTPAGLLPKQEQTPRIDPFLRSHSLAEAIPRRPALPPEQLPGPNLMALMLIERTLSAA